MHIWYVVWYDVWIGTVTKARGGKPVIGAERRGGAAIISHVPVGVINIVHLAIVREIVDPRLPTMLGRKTSGLHRPL